MTKQTTNLNLNKPDMADQIALTISQLGSNFDIIDASITNNTTSLADFTTVGKPFLKVDLGLIASGDKILSLHPSIVYVINSTIDLSGKTVYGNGATITVNTSIATAITANNTRLRDITLDVNHKADIGIDATGDYLYLDNVNVKNNGRTLGSYGNSSIRVFTKKAVIINSSFAFSYGNGIELGNFDIVYSYSMNLEIKNSYINNNECYGIVMRNDNNTMVGSLIDDCDVFSNGNNNGSSTKCSGIAAHFMANTKITNCRSYLNKEHGITLMDSPNSRVINNDCHDNLGSGIRLQADSTREAVNPSKRGIYNTIVSENLCHHNTNFGIWIGGYVIATKFANNLCYNNLRPIQITEDYTGHLCDNLDFRGNQFYNNTDCNLILFKNQISNTFSIDTDSYLKEWYLMPQRIYNPTTIKNVIKNSNFTVTNSILTDWTLYGTLSGSSILPDGTSKFVGSVFAFQDNDYLTICTRLGTITRTVAGTVGKVYIGIKFTGTNVTTGNASSFQYNIDDIVLDTAYFNSEVVVNTINISKILHDNPTVVKANIANIELYYYGNNAASVQFISSNASYGKEIPYVG